MALGASGLSVLLPVSYLWGFSVDDAWIITRVVQRGLQEGIFAFNPQSPATDAITPWGLERLLALFASKTSSSFAIFEAARFSGLAAWLLSWGLIVREQLHQGLLFRSRAFLYLSLGALFCIPGAAWAGAGLETPWATLLFTGGMIQLGRSRPQQVALGALFLGAAACWRPELQWATACALFLRLRAAPLSLRTWALPVLCWLSLPLAVAAARWVQFGFPLPLSWVAKSPDFSSGLRYALGASLLSGVPWLLLDGSPSAHLKRARWIFFAHTGAVLFAGGDWMPLYRLYVPLFPWLVGAVVSHWQEISCAPLSPPQRSFRGGLLLHVFVSSLLLIYLGSDSRAVLNERTQWIQQGSTLLADSRVIAAVDIGWLGLASPATIVDLAGVTDPKIAALPGGHTSKKVSFGLFAAREVDTWVIRAQDTSYTPGEPLSSLRASYRVDQQLLRPAEQEGFVGVAVISTPSTGGQYVIARDRNR